MQIVVNMCNKSIYKIFHFLKIFIKGLILFVFIVNLYAQEDEIQFSHITAEDGLSLNVVTKVFQDSKGFMWFGTYNGLNRYDGYNFKIFLPQPSNPNSISNHSILSMCEDKEGNLWIGTSDGLNKYDYKTEKFIVYKNNPNDSTSISNNFVYSIYEDRSGTLWIGTTNGLNRYNRKGNNFSVIKKVSDKYNDMSLNWVNSIFEDDQGNLWLGVWNGLSRMQKDGNITKYNIPGLHNLNSNSLYTVSSIVEDNDKNLWIGTAGSGLFEYNLLTKTTKCFKSNQNNIYSISSDYINSVYIDRLNNLWIGTRNGLNKFNPLKGNFTRFQNDLFKPFSIINSDVLSICGDKTGLIWLGTFGGVSKFSQTLNKFSYYRINKENPVKGLSSSNIISAFNDKKNNVWIGTDNGLDEVKNNTGEIVHYRNEPKNKNSLNNNEVRSVLVDHSGIVWIGTNGGGLNRYDPATGNFSSFKSNISDTNSISNNGVNSLCEDYKGNLWVGTWWGLNYLDHKNEKFIRYLSPYNNSIWALHEDSKRMLWIGTDGGGTRCFNPGTGTFKYFFHDSSDVNSISSNKVVSICETHDEIMWFSTSNGLSSYDRWSRKFKNYGMDDGLPSLSINSVIEDEKGYLWISTDKGLSKFDRKKGSFSNFTKRNGLKDTDFLSGVVSKSSNNVLYFGGKYSLVSFNPDDIHDELMPVSVVFTDLKIFNQSIPVSSDGSSILNQSIASAKSLEIPSYDDVITLDFALLDYYNTKVHTFKYKLLGFDDQWNDIGTRNNATYTNLPPGDYTFYVKAINNNDKRSEEEASIKINIIPSFYQTLWFKILSVLLFISLIILFYKIRTQSIQKRNKILADLLNEKENLLSEKVNLLEEKEVLLKEIHHRVKNNLQVISSLLYLNSKKIKDKEALSMFKDSQSRVKSIALVHERLYRSADLSRIDFKEYVYHLTNDLLRSYAINQSLIKLDININNIFIDIDFAVPCGLIINELVSNSLKYAFSNCENENKTGIIKIDFNKNGSDKLVLIISDNGVGMPEEFNEKKKLSLGLQLVDTLAAQLSGTLEVNQSSGTEFKIIFNGQN